MDSSQPPSPCWFTWNRGGNSLSLLLFLMTASRTPSLWIHPPEPSLLLSKYHFNPATLWCPRIFLWITHPSGLMVIFMKEPRSNLEFVYFQVNVTPQVTYCISWIFCCAYYSFIETLRICLGMEPYSEEVETQYKLSSGDSWLRKWQGLALQFFCQQHLKLENSFSQKFKSLPPSPVSLGKAR